MANEVTDGGLQSVSAPKADAYSDLEQSRKDLVEQQKRLMLQLEERSKPQSFDFWASLARGFGDPNAKTFSQGIGSAAGNIQALNEQKKAQELQTAQMRMAVAQSMLEQQGLASVANTLSGSGESSTTGGATAGMTTPQRSVFNSLSPQDQKVVRYRLLSGDKTVLRQLSEQAIKDTGTPDAQKNFNSALAMLPIDERQAARQVFARAQTVGKAEDALAGIAALGAALRRGEINEETYRQGIEALDGKLTLRPANAPNLSGSPASSSGDKDFTSNLRGTPQEVFAQLGTIVDPAERRQVTEAYLRQLDAQKQSTAQGSLSVLSAPGNNNTKSGLPILSPADIAAMAVEKQKSDIAEGKENRKTSNEPYVVQQTTISNFSPIQVGQNISRLNELEDIVKRNPEVVGLMVRQGPMYALMQAAESGVTTPFGSISVPVSESLAKLKLTPTQQAVARNITQIISDLNQQVMKEGRSIFGPSISTYDAQKMAEPGFKNTDPASFIMYLANKHKVTNHFMGEMNSALNEYREKNPDAGANKFFTDKNSPYGKIANEFHATYNDLVKNRSPYR